MSDIGIALAKQSFAVLKQRKSLLIFMTLSTLLTVIAFIIAINPLFNIEDRILKNPEHIGVAIPLMILGILLVLFMFLNMFNLLFSAALMTCAMKHLQDQPYSLTLGFKTIITYCRRIYAWQAVGNTRGGIIKLLAYWVDHWNQSPYAMNLLAGLPWHVAMQLVLPVILTESYDTMDSVKQSAHLIKNTWGVDDKSLRCETGLGAKLMWLRLALIAPLFIALLISGGTESIALIVVATVSTILLLLITTITQSVQLLTTTALFLFAKGIDVSRYYDATLLKNAFRPVKRKTWE